MNWKILDLNKSYVPCLKCSTALAAGIAATAATLGTAANASSAAANSHQGRVLARWQQQRNEQLTREQWAAQRKMFEDSIAEQRYIDERNRQWQLSDTESERNWNSAKEQVQRLKDAGINPYLAMTEGAAGQLAGSGYNAPSANASSSPSGSLGGTANTSVSPSYAPLVDFGRGISEAASQFYQALKTESDIQAQDLKNQREYERLQEDLAKSRSERRLTNEEYEVAHQTLLEAQKSMRDRMRGISLNNDMLSKQMSEVDQKIRSMRLQDELSQAASDSNLKVNAAQIASLSAQVKSSLAMAANYNEDTYQKHLDGIIDRWAKRVGIQQDKANYKLFKDTFHDQVLRARKETYITSPFYAVPDYSSGYTPKVGIPESSSRLKHFSTTHRW